MTEKIKKQISWWTGVIFIGVILGASLQFVRAWVEPSVAPPGGNVGAPLNTGQLTQRKGGNLNINKDESYATGLIVHNDLYVTNGGYLGVGTINPSQKLDVRGKAYFSNNVGIGTSSPNQRLDVNGNALFSGSVGIGGGIFGLGHVKLDISDSGQNFLISMNRKFNGSWPPAVENGTTNFQSTGASSGNLAFVMGNSEVMRISSAGKVGIGSQNPQAKLDIMGNIKITDGTQEANKVLTSDANGAGSWQKLTSLLKSQQVICKTKYLGHDYVYGCTATCPAGTIVTGGGFGWGAVYSSSGRESYMKDNGWFCAINIELVGSSASGCSSGNRWDFSCKDDDCGCKSHCYATCLGT